MNMLKNEKIENNYICNNYTNPKNMSAINTTHLSVLLNLIPSDLINDVMKYADELYEVKNYPNTIKPFNKLEKYIVNKKAIDFNLLFYNYKVFSYECESKFKSDLKLMIKLFNLIIIFKSYDYSF